MPHLPPGLRPADVLSDYRVAYTSRQLSVTGRREVLNGKAKFGIFGDGKEVAQVALARSWQPGDWRSGYYRDQTLVMALGLLTPRQFFAQLYADPDLERDPHSGGRQMNAHFATRFITPAGKWADQTAGFNIAADLSPTGGQMARLVGLAYASRLYRDSAALQSWDGSGRFSRGGQEVAFGTIGNASSAEGVFWESLNAAGVLQVPMLISVWDDDYGISVPNELQLTGGDISRLVQGFAAGEAPGYHLARVDGGDYPALVATYRQAAESCRQHHRPALVHVHGLTQPQGHSTSGSHERYKSAERLQYEKDRDGIAAMRRWLVSEGLAAEEELSALEEEAVALVDRENRAAWEDFQGPLAALREELLPLLPGDRGATARAQLQGATTLSRRLLASTAQQVLEAMVDDRPERRSPLLAWIRRHQAEGAARLQTWLTSGRDPGAGGTVAAALGPEAERVDGRQVIQRYFDGLLARDPRVFIIGEDVGVLGGVNLEFEGLQAKHGVSRVSDTGIREATILGQGIGAAMRGLRPVVDIQYLDYLIYALQGLSDDVASLCYRTAGGQVAPVIIRTKGHRLEGIWHTGSPIAMILGALRGLHLCVPRDAVQAVGFYASLLQGDDPGVVIEVLSGYRLKERCPTNLESFALPLGVPETMRAGSDLTVVTYGANVRLVMEAAGRLAPLGIDLEVIDVQTLLPFDRERRIRASVAKTQAVLFVDEDVPGGSTAYMLQQVLEVQGGYDDLDAPPRCLSARPHRSAFGSDGDYYCKPSVEDVVREAYAMMRERDPRRFPDLFA